MRNSIFLFVALSATCLLAPPAFGGNGASTNTPSPSPACVVIVEHQADQEATVPTPPTDTLPFLTTRQREVLKVLADRYERDGTLVGFENAKELTGVNYSLLVGRSQYRPGERSAHLRIFDSPYHLWIRFDEEIRARRATLARKAADARKWETADAAADARLARFSLLTLTFKRDNDGEFPRFFLDYLQICREELLPSLVQRAADHYQKTGELVTLANCEKILGMSYDQVMGKDWYLGRPTEKKPHDANHRRVSNGAVDFWCAFDDEIRRRLTLPARYPPKFLQAFNLLDVDFKAVEEGALLADLGARFDYYRPKAQEEFIQRALDIYAQTGILFTFPTAGPTYKAVWIKVVGRQEYGPEGGQYHRRLFDSPAKFWLAFEAGRKARLTNWPLGTTRVARGRSFEKLREQFEAFCILDVRLVDAFGDLPNEIRPLYDEHRERERLRSSQRAARTFATTGVLVSRDNSLTVTGYSWDKLTGRGRYATGAALARQQIFYDPNHFWRYVHWEVVKRQVQLRALRRGLSDEEFEELQRLDTFDIEALRARYR